MVSYSNCLKCGEEIFLNGSDTQEKISKHCRICKLCGKNFHRIDYITYYDLGLFCSDCCSKVRDILKTEWVETEFQAYLKDKEQFAHLPFMSYIWKVGLIRKEMRGKYTHFVNAFYDSEQFHQDKDQKGVWLKFKTKPCYVYLEGTKEEIAFTLRFGLANIKNSHPIVSEYDESFLQKYLYEIFFQFINYEQMSERLNQLAKISLEE